MPEKIIGIAAYKNRLNKIHGGFKHPEKGHFLEISAIPGKDVEIGGTPCKRCSVSLWDIVFLNRKEAEKIVSEIFQYDLRAAVLVDRKKGLLAEFKIELLKKEAV